MPSRLMPTGECWCGCGESTNVGSFFLSGHDKVAESMLMQIKYGGVPEFLAAEGYAPGGRKLRDDHETWKRAGGQAR